MRQRNVMTLPEPTNPAVSGLTGCLCNGWDPHTCPPGPSRDRYGGGDYDDRPYCEGSWILPRVYVRREFAARLGLEEDQIDDVVFQDKVLTKEYMDREMELAEIEYHKPVAVCAPVRCLP